MAKVQYLKSTNHKERLWEEVLEEFILIKKTEGRAWRTINDYRDHVGRFFKRYPQAWLSEAEQRGCLLQHLNRGVGATAYNLDLGYIKLFLDYCVELGVFEENIAKKFKKRRTSSRIVNIPIDILKKLIEQPDLKSYAGYRDYTLILLTLDCGIRPNEALTLLLKDIDVKGKEIHVQAENAKTRVARTLPISDHTAKSLQKLMDSRSEEWDETIPVFCSWTGGQMDASSWRWRLIRYSDQLGHKISPYDLRHAFALNFLRNGGNVFALQRIMGHTDLSMTRRYIALTEGDIQGQHQKASPVNEFLKTAKRTTRIK